MQPDNHQTQSPGMLLKKKLAAGETVIGTFVKTRSYQLIEILGYSGLDLVVLDAEHAPFGPQDIDMALAAGRGVGLPVLVRVPSDDPAFINSCLDMGAAGIVAPHVRDADSAQKIVDAVKYARGQRGFSPSGRAGQYGQFGAAAYREKADAETMVWCQIEDREALTQLDDIADVPGVDCLFIGPADLAFSLECAAGDAPLTQAIETIAEAGRRNKRPVGIYLSDTNKVKDLYDNGISIFIYRSDQSIIMQEAIKARKDIIRNIH